MVFLQQAPIKITISIFYSNLSGLEYSVWRVLLRLVGGGGGVELDY